MRTSTRGLSAPTRVTSRLSGFALIVALTFGGGYALGQLIDPIGAGSGEPDRGHTGTDHDGDEVAR